MASSINQKLFSMFMRRRKVPFGQYRGDNVETGDEMAADAQLRQALPLIGEVVLAFSVLEKLLSGHICMSINDRTDEPGLIILSGMQYRQRVELFERLSRAFLSVVGRASIHDLLDPLLVELREVGTLRNSVVHADWSSIDENGFAFVKVGTSESGLHEEHAHLGAESLFALVNRIVGATEQFDAYVQAFEQSVAGTTR